MNIAAAIAVSAVIVLIGSALVAFGVRWRRDNKRWRELARPFDSDENDGAC